jgi:hypothetical protein
MSLNDAKGHQIVNELYVQACSALLSAYGLEVSVREQDGGTSAGNKASYVSVLGANGDGISLLSMLKIERDLVIVIHPLGPNGLTRPDLEDWCLELNNQLVGRVKNKLLAYGPVLIVGLPVLLMGTDVSAAIAPQSEVHQYFVESADGQITLTLSTLVAPGVDLQEMEPSINGESVLAEGELALF